MRSDQLFNLSLTPRINIKGILHLEKIKH